MELIQQKVQDPDPNLLETNEGKKIQIRFRNIQHFIKTMCFHTTNNYTSQF